ncbi:MAG: NAD(P)H-dependent glycerol-3-phosphate dehydrogenase [Planctomycetota bacterium]|jgi:glycerol-3-phosphate dehydrogenase (NAD(P)+)
MKIAIVGNGGFGTALSLVAHATGHTVSLWGYETDYTEEMAKTRDNTLFLPGVTIPDEILVSSDAARVLDDADAVLMAVPTQYVRAVMSDMQANMPTAVPVISVAKGLEQGTARRPSQILHEVLGDAHQVLVLSGPSHAEEVALGQPATVVLAGPDADEVGRWRETLSCETFRIYGNDDLLGVELCGALKNVMALAAGMADGLGFGDNVKAAVLSRGIVEMSRYGVAEGARIDTFFGLAGMGDLAVTAFSRHGRNRAFGERIGRGETLDDVLASTPKVAEGVWTSRVVRKRASELGVEMPLANAVCNILFEGVEPRAAVRDLMARDSKDEVLR